MSAAEAVLRGRRLIESIMSSACEIRAPGGGFTTDPETGEVAEDVGEIVYSGKCRVSPASTWGRETEAGGERVSPSTFRISIPFEVDAVRRGHFVTVTYSPDSALIGRRFEVRFTPDMGEHITARRLLCEEPG